MENKFIGLGDVINKLASKFGYEIKDELLLSSLNKIELNKTEGLDVFYKAYEEPKYSIPLVSSQTILQQVNQREESFNKFWNMYNKKAGRTNCFKKWGKLSQKDIDKIFETLPAYLKHTSDVTYRKLPETYLNQRVWEDELYVQQKQQPSFNAFKF